MRSKVICILGMHRSGTSMATHLLNACGVYVGPQDQLLQQVGPPDIHYWEHLEVVAINKLLLQRLGGNWQNVPIFPNQWQESSRVADVLSRAKKFAQTMDNQQCTWGFKDPRTCLTLPFWKKVIPNMHYVIPYRAAEPVARSLQKRNGMPLHQGIALWTIYWNHLLTNIIEEKASFICYDHILKDPLGEMQALITSIKDDTLTVKKPKIMSIVSPTSRHFAYSDNQTDNKVPLNKENSQRLINTQLHKHKTLEHLTRNLIKNQQEVHLFKKKLFEHIKEKQTLRDQIASLEQSMHGMQSSRAWQTSPVRILNEKILAKHQKLHNFLRRDKKIASENSIPYLCHDDLVTACKKTNTTTKQPLVSIITLTHNNEDFFRCAQQLLATTSYENFEWIIVANGCAPEYKNKLKKLQDPRIKLIISDENMTFATGNNYARHQATGTVLVFLNDDVEVLPYWLYNLVVAYNTLDNVGAIGNILIYPKVTRAPGATPFGVQHAGVGFTWRSNRFQVIHMHQNSNPLMHTKIIEVAAVTAACLLVQANLFDIVGGFDPAYVYGHEDVDFCLKLSQAGKKQYVANESRAYHAEYATQHHNAPTIIKRAVGHNKLIFDRKWHTFLVDKLLFEQIYPQSGSQWFH